MLWKVFRHQPKTTFVVIWIWGPYSWWQHKWFKSAPI